jgi:hypothetical protein
LNLNNTVNLANQDSLSYGLATKQNNVRNAGNNNLNVRNYRRELRGITSILMTKKRIKKMGILILVKMSELSNQSRINVTNTNAFSVTTMNQFGNTWATLAPRNA